MFRLGVIYPPAKSMRVIAFTGATYARHNTDLLFVTHRQADKQTSRQADKQTKVGSERIIYMSDSGGGLHKLGITLIGTEKQAKIASKGFYICRNVCHKEVGKS